MDPLTVTGTLIAVLQITSSILSVCYDYRQGASSASRDVILFSDQLNALKDVLEALLRLVENSELGGVSRLSTVSELAKEEGTLDGCKKELKKLKNKLQPEEGWRKVKQSLTWPLKEKEMRKALDDLERFKSTMQLALSADQATLSLNIQDNIEDLTQMFQRENIEQKRQYIYGWLAAPDIYLNHNSNRKKRQSNTGTWLFKSVIYENWFQIPKSLLWIYGIPGSGKSVLCSTIIEQLVSHCHQSSQKALAYFYFDFNDTEKQDKSALLRSLITQLSSRPDVIPVPLLELYETHSRSPPKAIDDEALVIILQELVLMHQKVFIVFDALDESFNYEDILKLIKTIHDWDLSQLHLLVTSRQLPEIEDELRDLATGAICLQDSYQNEDIVIYVKDKLENDKIFAKWPMDIRSEIEKKLLKEGDGMFQWVVCQLDMLRRCLSVAAVRKAITVGLPQSLNQTYDQILSGIDTSYQADVMRILQVLTVSQDLCSLTDVVEILAVDLDSSPPRFNSDMRILNPRSILSMCSSLVTTQSGDSGNNHLSPILKLSHASVADYLLQFKGNAQSNFHFTVAAARQLLARICLGYLMNPAFASGYDKLEHKARLKNYPFLGHCIVNWPLYLRRRDDDPDEYLLPATRATIMAFLASSKLPNGGNFAFWVGALIPDSTIEYIQSTQPLYYAASFGLDDVVAIILDTEKDLDINALGGRAHSTALHVATFRKHVNVVNMLLERGADPSLPNNIGESPLYWAIVKGQRELQELLILHGAIFKKKVTYPTD